MGKVNIYLRLGKHFINEAKIISLKKIGSRTLIHLVNNEEILIDRSVDSVLKMLPSGGVNFLE